MSAFENAQNFMLNHARLIEWVLFEVLFNDGSPEAVGRVVRAYQNADGGLGRALEPDLRSPDSQPIFIEVGLQALHTAAWKDPALALELCGFLEKVSGPGGLVPPILPSALKAPHAQHWTEQALAPALNPTAGICGLLHFQGIDHPWLEQATETCLEMLLAHPPQEAHTLLSASHLAESLPDRQVAQQLFERLAAALPQASYFIAGAPVTEYGLTPLHFAPTPRSPWRAVFSDAQVEGHLQDLLARQQADGGWKIFWEAPGLGAQVEWRARWTLEALQTLTAYGLLEAK
jgi:hypothetical protein